MVPPPGPEQSGTLDAAGKARRVPWSGASPLGSSPSTGWALGSGALGVRASGPRGLRSTEQGPQERPAGLRRGWAGVVFSLSELLFSF